MGKLLAAATAGLLFGLGLAVSQMVDPAKIIGFLDVAGDWDPSLAFVMGGALVVSFVAFRLIQGRGRPILAPNFVKSGVGAIDRRLVGGSVIFGVGWGLVGFCPGPAISSLAYGRTESLIFVVAMVVGALIYRITPSPAAPKDGVTTEA